MTPQEERIAQHLFAQVRNKTIAEVYAKLNGQTVTQKSLAKAFGVSQAAISQIISTYNKS